MLPIAAVSAWAFPNPRLFPKPKTTNTWVSKGVLGERIFTQERKNPDNNLPAHHLTAADITTAIAGIGSIILIYGLVVLQIWPTLLGGAIAFLGKMWYVDRMVWLFNDMKAQSPFRDWLH